MKMDISTLLDAKVPFTEYAGGEWDLFISAYNDSARVQHVFSHVVAKKHCWWIIPEYGYSEPEVAHLVEPKILSVGTEAEVVKIGLEQAGFDPCMRLCIDITGLMRPHILFLMAYLKYVGVREFHFVYTEPKSYSRRSETRFSIGEDVRVGSVSGYMGSHETDTSGDVLVLGIGYDHHLISHVLQAKENARIVQLHSFPSLSADMYHESILRLDRVRPEGQRAGDETYYTSANDPFVVASSLETALSSVHAHRPITNIYLSPLATKPQAVGFGLFYLRKYVGQPASIIYPNCPHYDRETSNGIGRSWVYPIIF
jgi:hypothetical protein